MINAVGAEWFLTNRGGIPKQRPKIVMDEFIRCFTPKTVSGACRDYRAGANINFDMDAADKDKPITTPLLVLWGTRGQPPTNEYPTVWRKYASNLVDIQPVPTGHYIQEEQPDRVYNDCIKFFTA
jgi:haloacetate dehalogenase